MEAGQTSGREPQKESMLAWVRSVPMAQSSLPVMEMIAERWFNDLALCILKEGNSDERLGIRRGLSKTTIPTPGEIVKWALREAKSLIPQQAAVRSLFIPSTSHSCSMSGFY